MAKWRLQMKWWGLVDGYPSVLWKTIQEHDNDVSACRALDELHELHGSKVAYRLERINEPPGA